MPIEYSVAPDHHEHMCSLIRCYTVYPLKCVTRKSTSGIHRQSSSRLAKKDVQAELEVHCLRMACDKSRLQQGNGLRDENAVIELRPLFPVMYHIYI